ncbi:MAG: hypothetical protein HYR90_01940 [Candidatus Andersenbacteria bacterium]|nr:hypothetical protein [Candidatus Andersenbacteria bacterium]MBI3250921.1 hypothetical protein [Candidatus Andersenbacteria bacterium]
MQNAWGTWALALVAFGVFTLGAVEVKAVNFDELRQQLEERRAARRALLEERFPDSNDNEPTQPNENGEENTLPQNPATCECSTKLGLARPDIRWNNGVLELVPRFDVAITVDGEEGAEPWDLTLAYNGKVENTTFNGQRQFGAQCFDGRYKYSGIASQPVTVSSILRSAFGTKADQEVPVHLAATLSGCDSDSITKQAAIRIRDLGNMKIGTWRTVR